jgi:hypothetical protein
MIVDEETWSFLFFSRFLWILLHSMEKPETFGGRSSIFTTTNILQNMIIFYNCYKKIKIHNKNVKNIFYYKYKQV